MLKQMNKSRANKFVMLCCCVALLWFFGILAGKWIASGLSDEAIFLIHPEVTNRGSLLLFLLRATIPLFVVCLLWHYKKQNGIFGVLFLKALLLSFSACTIVRAYGSAGWLVARLLLFAEMLSCSLLVWIVLYLRTGANTISWRLVAVLVCLCVVIAVFDYFVLSPFTASLFQ